jgi:hypothetical protein
MKKVYFSMILTLLCNLLFSEEIGLGWNLGTYSFELYDLEKLNYCEVGLEECKSRFSFIDFGIYPANNFIGLTTSAFQIRTFEKGLPSLSLLPLEISFSPLSYKTSYISLFANIEFLFRFIDSTFYYEAGIKILHQITDNSNDLLYSYKNSFALTVNKYGNINVMFDLDTGVFMFLLFKQDYK